MKVAAPAPNQKIIVNVGMENVKGLFLQSDVTVQAHGNNLILEFANNGKIVFPGILPKLLTKTVSLRFADDSTLEHPSPSTGANDSPGNSGRTQEQRAREEFLASVHPVQRNFVNPPPFGGGMFFSAGSSAFGPIEADEAVEFLEKGTILPGLPFFLPLLDFSEDALPGFSLDQESEDMTPGGSRREPAQSPRQGGINPAVHDFPPIAEGVSASSLSRDILTPFVRLRLSSACAASDLRTIALNPPQETLAWQRLDPFRPQTAVARPDRVNGATPLSPLALLGVAGERHEFPLRATFIGDGASYKNILGYYTIADDGAMRDVCFLWFNACGADQETVRRAWRDAGADEKRLEAICGMCSRSAGSGQLIAGRSEAPLEYVAAGDRFGLFLLPNGYAPYAALFAGKEPEFFHGRLFFTVAGENGPRPATIHDHAPTLVYRDDNGAAVASWTGAFHTAAFRGDECTPGTLNLNNDGLQHVLAGGVASHGLDASGLRHLGVRAEDLLIGFADQPGGGEKDYTDLVIRLSLPAAAKTALGLNDFPPLVTLSCPDERATLDGASVTAHMLNGAEIAFLGYDPQAPTGLVPNTCIQYAVTGFNGDGEHRGDTVTVHFTGTASITVYQFLLRSVRFVWQPEGTPAAAGLRALDYHLTEADGFSGASGRAFVLFRNQADARTLAPDVPEPMVYQGNDANATFRNLAADTTFPGQPLSPHGHDNARLYAELTLAREKAQKSQQAFDAAAATLYGDPWEMLNSSYQNLVRASGGLLDTVRDSEDLQARTHEAYTAAQDEYTNIAPCIAHAQAAYQGYTQARTACLQGYTAVRQEAAMLAAAVRETLAADPTHPLLRANSGTLAEAQASLHTARIAFETEHKILDSAHAGAMASINILEEKVQGAEFAHGLMSSAFTGFQQSLATVHTLYIALTASIHTLQARDAAAEVAYAATEVVPDNENLAILSATRGLLTTAQQEYYAALHSYTTSDRALQEDRVFLSRAYDNFREAHAEQHAAHTASLEAMARCRQALMHADDGAEVPPGTGSVAEFGTALARTVETLDRLPPDIRDIATALGIDELLRRTRATMEAYTALNEDSLAALRLYAGRTDSGAFKQLERQVAVFADANAAYSALSHELSGLLLAPIETYSLAAQEYTEALSAFEVMALELGFTTLSQAAASAYDEYNSLHVAYLKAQGIIVSPGTGENVLVLEGPTGAAPAESAPLPDPPRGKDDSRPPPAGGTTILLSRGNVVENIEPSLDQESVPLVPDFTPETDVLDLTPLLIREGAGDLDIRSRIASSIVTAASPENAHDALVTVGEFCVVLGNALARHSPEALQRILVEQQVNLLIIS